jgi:hypothetical protein
LVYKLRSARPNHLVCRCAKIRWAALGNNCSLDSPQRVALTAQVFHLHVGHFSLALTTYNLLDLRVLGQRITRPKLGLAKAHRNVRVNECHD